MSMRLATFCFDGDNSEFIASLIRLFDAFLIIVSIPVEHQSRRRDTKIDVRIRLKVPDTSFAEAFNDKLFVQTRGKDGLCFKLRDGEWKVLAGIPNDNVVDTEGAGDWTTATIIYGIVRSGKSFAELNEEDLIPILMEAQRFASEKVSYLGSKGDLKCP